MSSFSDYSKKVLTLQEIYTKPLSDVVQDMKLVKTDIYSNDNGEVQAIVLKYEVQK